MVVTGADGDNGGNDDDGKDGDDCDDEDDGPDGDDSPKIEEVLSSYVFAIVVHWKRNNFYRI